jgi:hypothetical protein
MGSSIGLGHGRSTVHGPIFLCVSPPFRVEIGELIDSIQACRRRCKPLQII